MIQTFCVGDILILMLVT